MNLRRSRTRIKMCGMTRGQDIQSACRAGVDAIGLVFYPPSPRAVTLDQAAELSLNVSPLVNRVALFVNADEQYVREVIDATGADLLQFHGDESEEFCQKFNKRYIKALRVKDEKTLQSLVKRHESADAILLDTYVKGVPGGTGALFNWNLVPPSIVGKVILAGGLTPANVGEAVRQVRPFAVDVSGGIEQSPGIKDDVKISAFMNAVFNADRLFNENCS